MGKNSKVRVVCINDPSDTFCCTFLICYYIHKASVMYGSCEFKVEALILMALTIFPSSVVQKC